MHFTLNPLQRGVMEMVAAGMSSADISLQMSYSQRQAKRDIASVIQKIGGGDRERAIHIWLQTKNNNWLDKLKE